MPTKVSVTNLSIAFGATQALEGVSLTVSDGEFVSIVGPSGCGKSTMLNVIAKLLPPTDGSTRVAGVEGNGASAAKVGYMFQKDTLLPWATTLDNVYLPMDVQGVRDSRKAGALIDVAICAAILSMKPVNSTRPSSPSRSLRSWRSLK